MTNGNKYTKFCIMKKANGNCTKYKQWAGGIGKETSLSASIWEISFFSLNLVLILSPAGYPLAIPTIQAKLPIPGTLNKGRIICSNNIPINCTTPKLIKSSAVMKNGNNEGKTTSHHACRPRKLALSDCSGNMIKEHVIIIVTIDKNIDLIAERK